MLGANIVKYLNHKYDIYFTDKTNFKDGYDKKFIPLNLLDKSYENIFKKIAPDVIIHCGAITDVDFCEKNKMKAYGVNALSVRKFLRFFPNSRLIHISSDAVFSDHLHLATEKEETEPLNTYGLSKLLGENEIKIHGAPHLSIRTTLVGLNINPKKQSFIEWVITSIKGGKNINLFNDVLFTPISVYDFIQELDWIINNHLSGIIHLSGDDVVSKFDFGRKICDNLNLNSSLIMSKPFDKTLFNASRSKDQTLDSSFYKMVSIRKLPTLKDTVLSICNEYLEKQYE